MKISRSEFDQQPFAIRAGALLLWATPLVNRQDKTHCRQLYSFNDFFAEMCYERNSQQLTCVCTYPTVAPLEPYLESIPLEPLFKNAAE